MLINLRKVGRNGRLFLAVVLFVVVGISLTYCGDEGGNGGGVGTNSAIMERALSSFASTSYQGYLNQATCTGIWGWAWDANNPTSTVSVDIYDGSTKLTTVAANQYVASLAAAGIGNGYHAFSYVPNFTDGKTHTINVYYSGTTTALSGSPMTTPTTCSNVSYQGYLNQASCTGIWGWAWDANNPTSAINVDIYDGSTKLTTVAANQYMASLAAAGIGNGYHAFSYVPSFTDGKTHTINVYYSGTTINLSGSPMQTSTCSGGSVSYQGYLNGASCTGIWGWAWEPGNPSATVSVDIYDSSTKIATVAVNQYGADLAAAGIGNGYHAFVYVPSFTDGKTHTINVYYSGTTTALTGSPMTTATTCSGSSVSYQGYLNGASCTGIYGWAWQPGNPSATVSVDIYNGNTIIAPGVPATVYRADLAAAGIGNGDYSFSYVPSFNDGQAHSVTVYYSGTTTNLTGSPATTAVCGSSGTSSTSTTSTKTTSSTGNSSSSSTVATSTTATTSPTTGNSSMPSTSIPEGIASFPTTSVPAGVYSISGKVALSNGSPMAGVPLTIALANIGILFATTTTDANGNYTFTGLAIANQYVITPNETGYTFSQYAYTLTLNGNVTGINFTGTTATGYTISGYAQGFDENNFTSSIQGVTIDLTGYAANGAFLTQQATSDNNGYYFFPGIPNGNYIVLPGYDDHSFGPTDTTITVNGANLNNVDFFSLENSHNH